MIVPATYQPRLPLDKLLVPVGAPGAGDRMELDVLIVGAGPAGLAAAIELAGLARRSGAELGIGVLEKAEALGEHSLSGAVVNPRAFRELFPHLWDADFPFRGPVRKEAVYLLTAKGQWRLPVPPTMHNAGLYVASLCEIVRWLGHKAEDLGVTVFTGFPAAGLLVDGEGVARVAGHAVRESADLCAGREGDLGDAAPPRPGDPHARLAASQRRLRRQLSLPARAEPAGARSRRRARLPERRTRRARAAPEAEAPSAVPALPRRRGGGRVGSEDDPRRGLLRSAAAPPRRGRRPPGRLGRVRGRPLAQGDPLRDAVGHLRRARDARLAQGGGRHAARSV